MGDYYELKNKHTNAIERLTYYKRRTYTSLLSGSAISLIGVVLIRHYQQNDQAMTLSFSMITVIIAALLISRDVKNGKMVEEEVTESLIEGEKQEKTRRFGESYFSDAAKSYQEKPTVIRRAIPFWLIVAAIFMRTLPLYKLLKIEGTEYYLILAGVTGTSLFLCYHVFRFLAGPYLRYTHSKDKALV